MWHLYGKILGYVLYLSVLKPGPYTHRAQINAGQCSRMNENKCLGLFKYWVQKLLNLINVKMVPHIKNNECILDISLDKCFLLLEIATVDHLQCICHICCLPLSWVFPHDECIYIFCQPYTFINVLAYKHITELVKSDTSTCHSTLDR